MRNNYAALESGWVPGHLDAFKPNAVGKICLYDMGGGGGPQESTTYTTNLPEYAEPYYGRMVERAEALSQEGYQPYTSERIAGFTPSQQASFQETLGMRTPTQFGQATGAAQQATQRALQSGYAPGQFSYGAITPGTVGPSQLERFQLTEPGAFTGDVAGQYMSPFQQSVTDIAKRQAVIEAQKAQLATNLGAARQGTYGGARQELARSERERALLQNLSDIQARGSQAAFENAQQQFERDRAARLGAQQANLQAALGVQQLGAQQGLEAQRLNQMSSLEAQRANQAALMDAQRAMEQSRQFGQTTGLEGLRLGLTGAQQLAAMGTQEQQAALQRQQAQQAVANVEQQLQQRRLDQAYQDFLAQREYPYRQLEFYNAMLRGLPVQANTTSTQYQAQPNIAQQVLGYGIPALALSRAFSAT